MGGDASELTPEVRKPRITVHTGPDTPSTLRLPVVEGTLTWE